MTVALQSVSQATRELERLTGIRNNIAGLIVELQTSKSYNPNHATWVSIYTDRLKENVLPQIADLKAYLQEMSLKVN